MKTVKDVIEEHDGQFATVELYKANRIRGIISEDALRLLGDAMEPIAGDYEDGDIEDYADSEAVISKVMDQEEYCRTVCANRGWVSSDFDDCASFPVLCVLI